VLKAAHDAEEFYEDRGARISILAGRRPPRPDTLKQTDQPPISTKSLADGAGHTFSTQSANIGHCPKGAPNESNRPVAALPDRSCERAGSARKRSSAEGVGCPNSGRLQKACRLCRLDDSATVYLFRGLASTGPVGGRAVRLSEGPLQVGLEIGPIDRPALSLNAPPAPSQGRHGAIAGSLLGVFASWRPPSTTIAWARSKQLRPSASHGARDRGDGRC
jgi:hypothetical protein